MYDAQSMNSQAKSDLRLSPPEGVSCVLVTVSVPEPIRDDLYWTSRKNSLEVVELFSINKVSLV